MNFETFYTEYISALNEHEIKMTDKAQHTVGLYFHLLMQAQERMNLTSYRSVGDFVCYHLLDTLKLNELIQFKPEMKLLDIGSGGGVPGLILAALHDWKNVGLVESIQKKSTFLKEVAQHVGMNNIDVYAERAEELAHQTDHREQYDIVTARALAPLPQAIELTAPFVMRNGILLLPRGANESSELSEELYDTLGISYEETHSYTLPGRNNEFQVHIYKKIAQTHEKYPRKPGKIRKDPL